MCSVAISISKRMYASEQALILINSIRFLNLFQCSEQVHHLRVALDQIEGAVSHRAKVLLPGNNFITLLINYV